MPKTSLSKKNLISLKGNDLLREGDFVICKTYDSITNYTYTTEVIVEERSFWIGYNITYLKLRWEKNSLTTVYNYTFYRKKPFFNTKKLSKSIARKLCKLYPLDISVKDLLRNEIQTL